MVGGSRPERAGNLPVPLTGLVGRDAEIADLLRLSERNRLVTLTGAGGVGKTRLAIELASRSAARHRAGAWFADLAGISDPSLVAATVAGALGVTERAGQPLVATICDHTSQSDLLLVLDNCEHVLEECFQLVTALVASPPYPRIIATSREPLGIQGEAIWTVAPLALPEHGWTHPRAISRSPAVQLFVARAALGRPGFDLDGANAATVAAICRRVDGIPLALELSAARVRLMPLDEILFRLEHRADELASERRAGPGRHRTVRATLDWSYELLDDAERALFRRLSVFAGSFDMDAVAAVCSGGSVPTESLGLLVRLAEKSLISTAPPLMGRGRYRLLETVRDYARERLRENGEWERGRGLHARYFRALAETGSSQLNSPEQVVWVERLHAELDNMRTALEWVQLAEPGDLPRLVSALSEFWQLRGMYTEAGEWLTAAMTVERDPTRLRAQLVSAAGIVAWRRGAFDAARQFLEETVAIERQVGDPSRLGNAIGALGFVLFGSDDYSAAPSLFAEMLAIAQESGDRLMLAGALNYSAILALHNAELAEAIDFSARAVEIFDQQQHSNGAAYARTMWGLALVQKGDLAGAHRVTNEAVHLQKRLGDGAGFAGAINLAAEVAAAESRLERATILEGAADARFSALGARIPSLHRASRDRWLAAARRKLGARARPLMEKGAALTDAQVVAFVFGESDQPAPERDDGMVEGLSEREREVAQLMAAGLTNRQIATSLRVSVRTVDAHSEHIRNKLGVRSRAAIVAWLGRHL